MQKKRFGNYNKDFQLLADTLPMLVSVTKNPDEETKEQFIATHDRFLQLNETIKDKLADEKTAQKIQQIGKEYQLSLLQMSSIARIIRSYYFGEIKLKDFPQKLSEEIEISLDKIQEIARIVIREIINDNSREKQHQAEIEEINFKKLLEKYPEFQEQLITSDHIKLKSFPQPVRPSLKNWLADYIFNTGHKQHTSLIRGNYLFRNKNTQALNNNDRQKLNYILKAYDNNEVIKINTILKQIIFPQFKNKKNETTTNFSKPVISVTSKKTLPQDIFQLEKEVISPKKKMQTTIKKSEVTKSVTKKNNFSQKSLNQSNNSFPKPIKKATVTTTKKFSQSNILLKQHNLTPTKNKITFTSPQRMPFEKEVSTSIEEEQKKPQPLKITPENFHKNNSYQSDKKVIPFLKKNVVNLKNQE